MKVQKRRLVLIVCIPLLILLFYVHYDYSEKNPGGYDSVPRWLGTQAWVNEGISPYSNIVTERSQMFALGSLAQGKEDKNLFVYPFYVILFYLPLIWLPYDVARAIWMILNEACVIGIVICSINIYKWKPPLWLFGVSLGITVLLYNSVRTIILWQMAGPVAFLIIFSIWALKENKDIVAGIALGLATIKPQMIYLVIPLLVLWAFRNHKKFVVSLGITLFILAGFSFIADPTWLTEMFAQINDYPTYTPNTLSVLYYFTNLFQPVIGTLINGFVITILCGWLLWEWKKVIFENNNFDFSIALTLLITNLIVIRTATTNYLMMLPVFFYLFAIAGKKYAKSSHIWVFAFLMLFFAGTWALFALTIDKGVETWPSYFPMPVLLFCGLLWVRFTKKDDLSISGL